jgi:hypothetical protein
MVADKGHKHESRKKDFDPSSGRSGKKDSRYIDQLKKSADIRKVAADTPRLLRATGNLAPFLTCDMTASSPVAEFVIIPVTAGLFTFSPRRD